MNSKKPFKLGIVEGFFGSPWSWESRIAYADFLATHNFNTYLYAPKSDHYLRKQWQAPFPAEHLKKLSHLAEHYARANLDFGIGLSPFELYRDFSAEKRALLKQKLHEINQIKPHSLCILFDDMRGDFSDLAQQQANIMEFVAEHSTANELLICPTYYSYDPLLIAHFGAEPDRYLEDLGYLLNPAIDIFWTGPKVISSSYPAEHLQDVAAKLQRKALIWDNYPVNDSKSLSNFLHLRAPVDNSAAIKNFASGHMSNPMNQASLSQLPLLGLSQLYRHSKLNQSELFHLACTQLCPPELASALLADSVLFQDSGLTSISDATKNQLLAKYEKYKSHPMAKEIIDWLQGKYIFDPACLT